VRIAALCPQCGYSLRPKTACASVGVRCPTCSAWMILEFSFVIDWADGDDDTPTATFTERAP
jgi:predicted Zn-ribbon and HTH transcriptional regulator